MTDDIDNLKAQLAEARTLIAKMEPALPDVWNVTKARARAWLEGK